MGLRDRLGGLFGGRPTADEDEDAPATEVTLDIEARREQLDRLDDALRVLARSMAADASLMANPGWNGRVEDYRWAAREAARLSQEGFDRTALLDLANQIRPLYVPGVGVPPPEYVVFEAQQAKVMVAVDALRKPLPSESA